MFSVGRSACHRLPATRFLQTSRASYAFFRPTTEIRKFSNATRGGFGVAGRILSKGLDLEEGELVRIFTLHPALARLTAADIVARLVFLKENANISKTGAIGAMVRKTPQLLSADVHIQMAPMLATLQVVLPPETVVHVICECPDVLLREPGDISELRDVFHSIGILFESFAKAAPQIVGCEAGAVQNVYDFLCDSQSGAGMAGPLAAKVITSFPTLVMHAQDPRQHLESLVCFLRDVVGIDPASEECAGFYALPEKLDTIQPTVEFLIEFCSFPTDELRDTISLFVSHLQLRIYPRMMYLHKAGIGRPSIRALAGDDDEFFEAVGAQNMQAYQEFRKGLRSRDRDS